MTIPGPVSASSGAAPGPASGAGSKQAAKQASKSRARVPKAAGRSTAAGETRPRTAAARAAAA
ncbi:hypothetical protein ABZ641_36790, partial [Kitasatospora sp. NPDC007106]